MAKHRVRLVDRRRVAAAAVRGVALPAAPAPPPSNVDTNAEILPAEKAKQTAVPAPRTSKPMTAKQRKRMEKFVVRLPRCHPRPRTKRARAHFVSCDHVGEAA